MNLSWASIRTRRTKGEKGEKKVTRTGSKGRGDDAELRCQSDAEVEEKGMKGGLVLKG